MSNNPFSRLLGPFYAPVKARLHGLSVQADRNAVLLGQLLARQQSARTAPLDQPSEAEFKVFSQYGEDGIIQYLLSKVSIERRIFVELGVGDYRECNTRFLLLGNGWGGLVIEGDKRSVDDIRSSAIYRRYSLRVASVFVTKENINTAILGADISGDIGLLSIDVDGNDYWIWEALNVIQPRIVVCEFNRRFGCHRPVSIPYQSDFQVHKADPSRLYFGASLPAFCSLANQKGYDFVGCTSQGVNAFFVRQDLMSKLPALTAEDGFKSIAFSGELGVTFPGGLEAIDHLMVYDFEARKLISIGELRRG